MRTNEQCVEELHRRMRARRRMKVRRARTIGAASVAACLILTLLAALGVSRAPFRAPGAAQEGAAASILVDRGSLGFVLVGLLGFCLGALVTILCFRLRTRAETKPEAEEEEERNDR